MARCGVMVSLEAPLIKTKEALRLTRSASFV
jgi:hypothetical protein